MVIVDMADIISMQNWDHLLKIFHKLNWRPKLKKKSDLSNVDFSRLRYCYINNHQSYFRQNIMISKYMSPNMKMLFNDINRTFCNYFGRIKIRLKYNGILDNIIPMIKQYFRRFNVTEANNILLNNNKKDDINEMLNLMFDSDNEDDNNDNNNSKSKNKKSKKEELKDNLNAELLHLHEARFLMYKEYILPIFRKSKLKTLIFCSSYFDFLRLRRLYRNVNTIRFVSEYSEDKEANKFRREFGDINSDINYLVITERYYFYNHIRCEGAQRTIFYGLPDNSKYYVDILNWMSTQQQFECYSLYCKYDCLSLERIVGTKRMIKMINNINDVQIFL